jgi:predicted membrane protein (TIGR00267 family)
LRISDWFRNPKNRLDPIAGFCDGILTALTLAAGKITAAESSTTLILGFKVGIAGAASGAFVFFVAHYTQMRGELLEAERQLNLTSHGRFASSILGKAIFIESLIKASIASAFSFLGAVLPLSINAFLPMTQWFTIVITLLILGVLGIFLALSVRGKPLIWAAGLILAGVILTIIGMEIKLV